jgi:hypothetical protein
MSVRARRVPDQLVEDLRDFLVALAVGGAAERVRVELKELDLLRIEGFGDLIGEAASQRRLAVPGGPASTIRPWTGTRSKGKC